MNKVIVSISFIASIFTIADMVYKIFVGSSYNFFSSIIFLSVIIAVQLSLGALLEIKIDKKDAYIVILYYVFIPIVITASSWGYYNYTRHSDNTYIINQDILSDYYINSSDLSYDIKYKVVDYWNNNNIGEVIFYSKKEATEFLNEISKKNKKLTVDKIKELNKGSTSNYDYQVNNVINKFADFDRKINMIIESSKIRNTFWESVFESIKISIIIAISTFLFIFWSKIAKSKYHENTYFLAAAFGIPSLFILVLGFTRYIIGGNSLDKHFIGYLIIIGVVNVLAYTTKDHESFIDLP